MKQAVFTAIVCLLLCPCFARAGQASMEGEIDRLFRDYSGPQTPGASVTVIRHGKVVFAKGYGAAVLDPSTPCSADTNFRLASLTKQFTAMSVLMLAEQGRLSLNDNLAKFFPELPPYGKNITIRQVLSHRSGLVDYEDVTPPGTTLQLSDRDVLTLVRGQDHTYFPPGTQFRYSNGGYCLLALLVEIVSGETFPAFLKQHIFEPLGMTNTVAYVAGESRVPNRALGYARNGDRWELSDQSVTSATLGDGGVYTSVKDLYKWDQALYTDKLVSRKTLQEAFSAVSPDSDFKGSGYGFGWYVSKRDGVPELWHYGSTCGFSNRIYRFPQKELTIIVLTNRRDADLDALMEQLIRLNWQE